MRLIAHLIVLALAVTGSCPTWCLTAYAQAPALQVSPILIQLAPGQMTTTLSVTNVGPQATTVQLRPFLWQQANGAEQLTDTDDLAVSPPITEIGSNETQTFRLVLRTPAANSETCYRLLLDQLPPASQPGTIRIALRLSIPVFATPNAVLAADVGWHLTHDADGTHLVGFNQGNRHLRVLNPTLTDTAGHVFAAESQHGPYILPSATAVWTVADGGRFSPDAALRLHATSDAGPVDTTVRVDAP